MRPFRFWEDIDLIIRLYGPGRFIHLPKPLYRHRLYGHNASRNIPSLRALDGRRRFLDKHAASCRPGTPEGDALSHDWAIYYADLGKHHLRANTPTAARQAFQSALRHDPTMSKHGRVWSDRILSARTPAFPGIHLQLQSHTLDGRRRNKTGG
ncbi:MAG: hypothetical protein IPM88_16365 [Nitrospira sp.]|nr:hypothetical protein [Nitrospira sp.]